MRRLAGTALLIVVLPFLPRAAHAQLGEMHVGTLVSYGAPEAFGAGAGLVVGVAAGRLTYIGLRWAYQAGGTHPVATPAGLIEVKTRVQVFAVDLGILFPVGSFEIVPGVSLGALRFAQRAGRPSADADNKHDVEFVAAPSVAVQARLAPLLLIPEFQYFLGGNPELPWRVQHRGPVASLRIVFGLEVDRIRH